MILVLSLRAVVRSVSRRGLHGRGAPLSHHFVKVFCWTVTHLLSILLRTCCSGADSIEALELRERWETFLGRLSLEAGDGDEGLLVGSGEPAERVADRDFATRAACTSGQDRFARGPQVRLLRGGVRSAVGGAGWAGAVAAAAGGFWSGIDGRRPVGVDGDVVAAVEVEDEVDVDVAMLVTVTAVVVDEAEDDTDNVLAFSRPSEAAGLGMSSLGGRCCCCWSGSEGKASVRVYMYAASGPSGPRRGGGTAGPGPDPPVGESATGVTGTGTGTGTGRCPGDSPGSLGWLD